MPIDPCREWLGIDAVDLVHPHLVLGVSRDETDHAVIERAAAERLRALEGVSPGPFEKAHAALVARVAEARDELLAAARAAALRTPPPVTGLVPPPPPQAARWSPSGGNAASPHPVPPPVWPPEPAGTAPLPGEMSHGVSASAAEPAVPVEGLATRSRWDPEARTENVAPQSPPAAAASPPVPVAATGDELDPGYGLRGSGPRRRRGTGSAESGTLVSVLALLVTIVAVLLAVVLLSADSKARHGSSRQTASGRVAVRKPEWNTPPRDRPIRRHSDADDQELRPPPRRAARRDIAAAPPAADASPAVNPPAPAPASEPSRDAGPAPQKIPPAVAAPPPAADDEVSGQKPDPAAAAVVDRKLAEALEAVRGGQFAAADRAVDAAADAAPDDAAAERVERWRLFVTYGRQLAGYRDTALAEAAKGGDYQVQGRTISVIEMNRTQFIYKDRGEMKRPRRDAIPPAIVLAILRTWFKADGRPANDIYLGVQHLLGTDPDVEAARAAWQKAGDGGEDVGPLLSLLADPVLNPRTR